MMNLVRLVARKRSLSAARAVALKAVSGYFNKQVLLLWRGRHPDRSQLEVERLGGHR